MTRPPLDIYPAPGVPSVPATWEDIERLAIHYPVVHVAVSLVERGDWTREQALVNIVYSLADSFSRLFHAEVDRKRCELPARFMIPGNNPL